MKDWAIVELLGHNVIAGFVQPDTDFPTLIRVDVPETKGVPKWTKLISPSAVYAINPVSEETARAKAESLGAVPISLYDVRAHIQKAMRQESEDADPTGVLGILKEASEEPYFDFRDDMDY